MIKFEKFKTAASQEQDASKWHFRGMLNVASFIPVVRFAIEII